MKTISDLNETESLKLKLSMSHISDLARAYSFAHTKEQQSEHWTLLLCASREFDEVCRSIGFDDHWKLKIVDPVCCQESGN